MHRYSLCKERKVEIIGGKEPSRNLKKITVAKTQQGGKNSKIELEKEAKTRLQRDLKIMLVFSLILRVK